MKTERGVTSRVSDGQKAGLRSIIIRDLLNVTWRMTVPTLLGVALGLWLDRVFGTHPILFLVGAVLGFLLGIYMALLVLKRVKEMSS